MPQANGCPIIGLGVRGLSETAGPCREPHATPLITTHNGTKYVLQVPIQVIVQGDPKTVGKIDVLQAGSVESRLGGPTAGSQRRQQPGSSPSHCGGPFSKVTLHDGLGIPAPATPVTMVKVIGNE